MASAVLGLNIVGPWLGIWFLFLILIEGVAVLCACGCMAFGMTGLTTAWWSPITRRLFPGRESSGLEASPTLLFCLGVIAVAPAAASLGLGVWAQVRYEGYAWGEARAYLGPLIPVVVLGILTTLVVAWRVCFKPFRRAWPRWVPLPIVATGSVLAAMGIPQFGQVDLWWIPCGVALSWTVAVGFASPSRLGLSPTASTSSGRIATLS